MTPDRSTVYPVLYDAQNRLQPVFLPRLQRRHAPAGLHQPGRLLCIARWRNCLRNLEWPLRWPLRSLIPSYFLHGYFWQPFTYSFIHIGLIGTLFELLSLWFLAGFLENCTAPSWVTGLYAVPFWAPRRRAAIYAVAAHSAIRSPVAMLRLLRRHLRPAGGHRRALRRHGVPALFHHRHQGPLPGSIYALISIAMLFGQQRMYAFAQLGGALAGLLFIRRWRHAAAFSFAFSERGTDCATATTAGSAAAPPASSRSTCARRAAPCASTARAADRRRSRTTRSAGTEWLAFRPD
jgi:membrane associated rhomboid family serine protease